MQSYCIYAEAFAGPFRPLRAPEPPFTHKTPPFTQVLFLFDAFYGTISLRKSSSLCSYKTESEAPMKKRILALLLAFSMMLSLLPVSALADTGGGIDFAAYASNGSLPDLVMDNNTGKPDLSSATQDSEGVYQGDGWRYVPQDSARNDKDTLYLDGASFNLSGASIWCNVVVSPRTTVENASFNYHDNPSGFPSVTNNGILQSCMFIECNITNNSTIQKSTIEDCIITNNATIRDSLFSINSSATLPFKFEKSGSITDSVFDFNPTTYGLTLNVHSLQASPIKALDISTASNPITYLYLRSNVFYTIGYPKIKVYCYNPDNPTGGSYKVCSINGVPAKSYDPDFGYASDSYIFTVQDEDVELSSSETTAPALEMDYNGWPKTDNMTSYNGVYYGDGWKYENGTLTLKSGQYDFNYINPGTSDGGTLNCVNVDNIVVQKGATIVGGNFRELSLLNHGTVENGLFSGIAVTNDGKLNCLFRPAPSKPKPDCINDIECHSLTAADNSTVEVLLYPSGTLYIDCTFYFTGTPKLTVKLDNTPIKYINGEEHYGDLKPSEDVSGYYTFTPKAGEDVVLNRKPYVTDLVMTPDGIPDTSNAASRTEDNKTIWYGTDWTYDGGTLTLESGSYDFTYTKPSDATSTRYSNTVRCNVVVNKGAAITGGKFSGDTFSNSGTVKDVLIMKGQITNTGKLSCLFGQWPSGAGFERHTVKAVNGESFAFRSNYLSSGGTDLLYFTGTPKFAVYILYSEDSTVHHVNGRIDYGGLKKEPDSNYYTFTPEKEEDIVLNDTIIHDPFTMTNGYPTASNGGKTACKGEGWEYILGNPEHGDFLFLSNAQIDFSKISDGSPVECKLFIGHGVAVQGGTFNGDVINNGGGILGGTFNGAVENHGTIENGVFNGAVTNIAPGTVSNSITGTGTLNGKPITPNAYTLTVTGGGLVNGKTSAVVEAGDEVRLTVGEMQEGMSFNYWDLPTALTQALTDSSSGGFSNKVEPLTFTMPDLSGYTEDKSLTIRLDIRPAELPDDDDGPSVLGTMATVAVGGAAAGILVWQGVSLGVDSYLQLSLPDGVPVPANRIELVKLLWETAGKPDVVLPALYGDVSAEDGELQKATRWAIDNGLVKSADESDASRFDPDRSVSKYEVARAWFKVQQMLK